jgi:hypothetical protein
MKNAELIQGLRDLLAFVESNDDFEFVPGNATSIVTMDFHSWYLPGSDDARRPAIADLTRRLAHQGKVEKLYSDEFAWIRLRFGQFVKFDISTMRKTICERVVVGKKVIPAQPERTIAATPERMEEEVEWRCHPVLTAGSSHTIEGDAPQIEASETPQLTEGVPF